MTSIGVFGGSFNPIHKGHIGVAEAALRDAALDKVLFVVANIQPLKDAHAFAPFDKRIAMVELVISGNSKFEVSDIEGRRGGISYTVDTLRKLKGMYGEDSKLFLIVGSDSVDDFPKWHKVEEILKLAELTSYPRGEFPQSSTEVRERLAADKPVDDMIDPNVLAYIRKHGLYTLPSEAENG